MNQPPTRQVLARGALVMAGTMGFAAFNNPFVTVGFDAYGYSYSSTYSLVDIFNQNPASAGGLLVLAGGLIAVLAAAYRAIPGSPGRSSARACLLGFAGFGAGAYLLAQSPVANTYGLSFSETLGTGFFLEMGFSAVAVVLSIVYLVQPVPPQATSVSPSADGPAPQTGQPSYSAVPSGASVLYPSAPGTTQSVPVQGLVRSRVHLQDAAKVTSRDAVAGETIVIGSDSSAEVRLEEPTASPRQVALSLSGAGWNVQALEPSNPAYLSDSTGRSGLLYGSAVIASGQIRIGSSRITMEPATAG